MRTKIISNGVLIGMLVLASCQKSFLNAPTTSPTPLNDPNVANDLVTGVYSSLIFIDAGGGWNFDTHGISFIAATNIMSDDADKGSFPLDQPGIAELDNFTETPSNAFVAALWSGYYAGIARTNNAMNALAVTAMDSATVKRLRGEVRFIRAYYYFNLVRFFGGVPIILYVPNGPKAADSDSTLVTRASASDVYNKVIVPDLQYAVANLPLKAQATPGRITKGAAETLLAKVYMYLGNWQEVMTLTQDVINSGQYSLVPDYASIWKQEGDNNAESIFEVETGQFNNTDGGIPLYAECQGPRGAGGNWNNPTWPYDQTGDLGWGFCTPSLSLINSYEPNDPRKAATIIFVNQDSSTTLWDGFKIPPGTGVQSPYYNYKAYHSEKLESFFGNRDRKDKNVHILRYAEVLLMNAEAATQVGGDAMTPLSMVRARVGLTTTSATQMDIWNERHIELALEHDRFFDIVRQGRAAQVMQAAGKNFVAGKNELLPIPGTQIALSGGRLTQNPNY
ncbi:MAG: RagB/SusD family nutrient uptake outer membrane protein [Bacteroidota bacterium]|nr:RagB/SusD family nutrient uptake outer membrane protein [Bacteroidota bacterium]MDP4214049.1 RagB/SusD family nutrient uptake outer membrane protein [Bacteroidota bacterium]MDP4248929.1 RagB/SusD family nutrient uptake outer membrane protein [Bacteroidota bacterium]